MYRSIATLTLIVLTSAFATAQVPGAAKQIDPKAVGAKANLPTRTGVQAKVGNLNPGDLKADVSKFLKHNVRIGDANVVVNETAGTVTVTVQNLGQAQERSVAVRLGVADAIDGSKIFFDQTRGTDPIAPGGSASVTFTGLNFAGFKQQVVAQFGPTNGNKLIVVANADPKGVIAETIENDNHGIKFIK